MASRNRAWADTMFCGSLLADEGTIRSNLLIDAPTVDTLTAVRIIVDLSIGPNVVSAADAANCISVGIGVTSAEGFAAGATPSPAFTDQYPPRGWLYIATKVSRMFVITSTGLSTTFAEFKGDFRAMRKVDKGILYMEIVNNAVVATGAVAIYGRVRVLCLT